MSKDPIIERLHKTKAVLENLNKEINNPIDIHISDYSLHDYKNLRQVIIEAGMIFCFSEKNKRWMALGASKSSIFFLLDTFAIALIYMTRPETGIWFIQAPSSLCKLQLPSLGFSPLCGWELYEWSHCHFETEHWLWHDSIRQKDNNREVEVCFGAHRPRFLSSTIYTATVQFINHFEQSYKSVWPCLLLAMSIEGKEAFSKYCRRSYG